MKTDLINNPSATELNGDYYLHSPERDLFEEAKTGLVYLLGNCAKGQLPLTIYAQKSDFTDKEVEDIRHAPLGSDIPAHAIYLITETEHVVVLTRPIYQNEKVSIHRGLLCAKNATQVTKLPLVSFNLFTHFGDAIFLTQAEAHALWTQSLYAPALICA